MSAAMSPFEAFVLRLLHGDRRRPVVDRSMVVLDEAERARVARILGAAALRTVLRGGGIVPDAALIDGRRVDRFRFFDRSATGHRPVGPQPRIASRPVGPPPAATANRSHGLATGAGAAPFRFGPALFRLLVHVRQEGAFTGLPPEATGPFTPADQVVLLHLADRWTGHGNLLGGARELPPLSPLVNLCFRATSVERVATWPVDADPRLADLMFALRARMSVGIATTLDELTVGFSDRDRLAAAAAERGAVLSSLLDYALAWNRCALLGALCDAMARLFGDPRHADAALERIATVSDDRSDRAIQATRAMVAVAWSFVDALETLAGRAREARPWDDDYDAMLVFRRAWARVPVAARVRARAFRDELSSTVSAAGPAVANRSASQPPGASQ